MVKKVLIIDDDQDFVEMNKAVLENKGYAVMTAGNSKDGIQLLKTQKPDLVLLDVIMGSDAEGFDAVERIRSTPEIGKTPIIMITSFDEHHQAPWTDKPDRSWVNVDNYLRKPVSPESLISEVEKVLGKLN